MATRIFSTHRLLICSAVLLGVLFFQGTEALAQGVGINTITPDPSAALDIQSTNRGVLLPRVSLSGVTDKTTIPAPAPGLLIYNTNAALDGAGFYYNNGTKALPNWTNLNQFKIPYYFAAEYNGAAFHIENYSGTSQSAAIKGYSSGAGDAIHAQNDDLGYALVVEGKMRIYGNGQTPVSGRVLTSDNNGNATWQTPQMPPVAPKIAFKASGVKGGGSEKIASGAESKIAFASEIYDLSNSYDDITANPHNVFTAPINGIYHFDIEVKSKKDVAQEASGDNSAIRLKKDVNGTISEEAFGNSINLGLSHFNSLSVDLKLNSGDKIFVTFQQNSGEYFLLYTEPKNTYFSGHLVTPL